MERFTIVSPMMLTVGMGRGRSYWEYTFSLVDSRIHAKLPSYAVLV